MLEICAALAGFCHSTALSVAPGRQPSIPYVVKQRRHALFRTSRSIAPRLNVLRNRGADCTLYSSLKDHASDGVKRRRHCRLAICPGTFPQVHCTPMSSEEPPAQNGALLKSTAIPELDVSKLHALPTEQQDLFLLNFVSDLRHAVESTSAEALPLQQLSVKKEVIKVVGLGSPVPSRVLRNNLAATLADAFRRGSRDILYETVNDLLNILNAGKIDRDTGSKHVSIVCLGALFEAAGESAVSLHGLVVQSLLKAAKGSSVGLRGSVFRALEALVSGLQTSVDEHVARDVWKAARNAAASEKSTFVQRCTFDCLRVLVDATAYFNNSNDFENLKSTAWKALDSPSPAVRHAVARTMAAALVKAYSESPAGEVPIVRKPKKSSKKQGPGADDEDDAARPGSPSPAVGRASVQLALTLPLVLRNLSSQFIKASTSNRERIGIASCYKHVLHNLPPKVVESGFGSIAAQLFVEILDHPSTQYNRYRYLLARKLVKSVLLSVIISGLLTENAQINAMRYLVNDILKNYPRVVKETRQPSKRVFDRRLGHYERAPPAAWFSGQCSARRLQRSTLPGRSSSKLHCSVSCCSMSAVIWACLSQPAGSYHHRCARSVAERS